MKVLLTTAFDLTRSLGSAVEAGHLQASGVTARPEASVSAVAGQMFHHRGTLAVVAQGAWGEEEHNQTVALLSTRDLIARCTSGFSPHNAPVGQFANRPPTFYGLSAQNTFGDALEMIIEEGIRNPLLKGTSRGPDRSINAVDIARYIAHRGRLDRLEQTAAEGADIHEVDLSLPLREAFEFHELICGDLDGSVAANCRIMLNEHDSRVEGRPIVRCLVMKNGERIVGIFTEGDLLKMISEGKNPGRTKVHDVMRRRDLDSCFSVTADCSVADTISGMLRRRFNHVLVTDGDKVVTVIGWMSFIRLIYASKVGSK